MTWLVKHIPKRQGGTRKLVIPDGKLKIKQKGILAEIEKIDVHPDCHGFVKGRSIITHAKQHIGSNTTLHLDLSDFFPSISIARVRGLFASEALPAKWAEDCCYEGRLAQGSPASPCLANLIARKMDRRLHGLAEANGCRYSRYADDIVISVHSNPTIDVAFTLKKACEIIRDEDFSPNPAKVKVKDGLYRVITGILVGPNGIDVPRSTLRAYQEAIRTEDANRIRGLRAFIDMVRFSNESSQSTEITTE